VGVKVRKVENGILTMLHWN